MRKTAIIIICTIVSCACPYLRGVAADEIIMTTGDHFTSSKVWEEGDKVLFDMQGLIVNVSKKDVSAVIRGAHPSEPSAAVPAGQTNPDSIKDSPPALDTLHAAKPASSPQPANPIDRDQDHKPKIRGIGFDGLSWQMHPNDIAGIERLGTDPSYGGIDQYWRPDGGLMLGDIVLEGLVFGFWQNRLYTIMVWVNGKPAYSRLQHAVFERYGSGRKNEKGLERYIWVDDTTDRMLEFDPHRNTGIFWMRSKGLDMRVKQIYPDE